jgi:hypothetical protein
MPSSAVAAGFVDLLLPVEDIPERILSYVRDWGVFDPKGPIEALANIHRLLRERTAHDFSDYKDRTFQRRVHVACRWSRPLSSKITPSGCGRIQKRSARCSATS